MATILSDMQGTKAISSRNNANKKASAATKAKSTDEGSPKSKRAILIILYLLNVLPIFLAKKTDMRMRMPVASFIPNTTTEKSVKSYMGK